MSDIDDNWMQKMQDDIARKRLRDPTALTSYHGPTCPYCSTQIEIPDSAPVHDGKCTNHICHECGNLFYSTVCVETVWECDAEYFVGLWDGMDDETFLKFAEIQIWQSLFAMNIPRKPAIFQAEEAKAEADRRGKPSLYQDALKAAYEFEGVPMP